MSRFVELFVKRSIGVYWLLRMVEMALIFEARSSFDEPMIRIGTARPLHRWRRSFMSSRRQLPDVMMSWIGAPPQSIPDMHEYPVAAPWLSCWFNPVGSRTTESAI
jgi:hypothetical protein